MSRVWMFLAGCLLMFTGTLSAQEDPLRVEGTLSSGFYNSYTRGGGSGDQKIQFVPAAARFEVNGYYLTPDLVDVWLKPEVGVGPQASEAGFQGGNGFQTRVNLLRRSAFPVTFRYSNVQLEDVYFGSLSRLSSYTLKNRNKDLGLTTELKRAGMPTFLVDWGVSSADSKTGISTIPDYRSQADHLNLDSTYVRWGWSFQGFAHRHHQTSDSLIPLSQAASPSALEQKLTQYQGSGRRSLPWDSELYIDAGTESTANFLLDRPIDLSTRYASANLRLNQKRKWRTSLRSGYTSNIAGLLLTQLIGGLGGNGSVAPDASVIQPLQRTISNINLNVFTSLDLPHGLGLYGSADRTAVFAAGSNGVRSTYLTTAGGLTYRRKFSWGNLSGQYGRDLGSGSVTGQTGKIEGQNYVANLQHGNRDRLQFDFSVHGTDQSIRNAQPANNHSFTWDASVARRFFGRFDARIGGGKQHGAFANAGTDFHNDSYTAHAGIEHPWFQLDASLNTSIGSSLQAYSQVFGEFGPAAALLTPLQLVASDLRGKSVSLHANPIRKLELSGFWTRSIQHLEGVVANDFEIIDVHATYHFRRLQFEAGYFHSNQIFSSYLAVYPETQRGRFYVRLSRTGRLL